MRFPFGKAYSHLTTARNTFFLLRRRIQLNVLSVFQLRGLVVEIFLQMGPWTSNGYNFLTVTPNQVIPKPTSSSLRARHAGIIFILC
jgi:hypothetical protein